MNDFVVFFFLDMVHHTTLDRNQSEHRDRGLPDDPINYAYLNNVRGLTNKTNLKFHQNH